MHKVFKILIIHTDLKFFKNIAKRLNLEKSILWISSSYEETLQILSQQTLNLVILEDNILRTHQNLISQINQLQSDINIIYLLKDKSIQDKNLFSDDNEFNLNKLHIINNNDLTSLFEIIDKLKSSYLYNKYNNQNINNFPCIIGETNKIQKLKKNLSKIAILDCPILIIGETGTGKELTAKAIHNLSFRKNNKFIAINCNTFNPEILLKEIFGEEYEDIGTNKRKRKGLLEVVQGGTLFLEEIEHAPLMIQSMILKFIEKKTFIPYGGHEEIKVDVRIIAATNVDLTQQLNQGKFREDLYYRLNAVSLELPPLRERKEDIPLLAYYFLNKYSKEFNKNINKISPKVIEIFKNYPFPGNVRELEYAIERSVIIADQNEITIEHLPARFKKTNFNLKEIQLKTLAEMEMEYILQVLNYTKGNKNKTAKILGISRTSLWRKLKLYNLDN
ncbi:MAG: sigma-54 dependent transcriptional regulator [Desulfonauticus sp.]|nr:sigma-54 dependent transcriptional regulator [Desulfonauticus sp.]